MLHRWVKFAHQRYHFGGEALQARDAFDDGLTAEIKDQLVHTDGSKGTDVAGDVVRTAGKASARTVAIRDGGVIQRRLVGDGERREIAPLRFAQALQRTQEQPGRLPWRWRRPNRRETCANVDGLTSQRRRDGRC
jgi:hypothetical protein